MVAFLCGFTVTKRSGGSKRQKERANERAARGKAVVGLGWLAALYLPLWHGGGMMPSPLVPNPKS